MKETLRIKLHLYLQELLGKNIAPDRDVAGFDERKKHSNNSDGLFSYLVAVYSLTGKDVLKHLVYSLSSCG